MKLYSRRYYDDGEKKIEELSISKIAPELKRAEYVCIVSAYYSISFLKKILKKVNKTKRNKCQVKLIFNGLSGQRLYEQVQDLSTFKNWLLKHRFKKVSIFINRETTLFHTKLYFIKNDTGSLWYVGSANATNSAFERNEEILLKQNTNINKIKSYISNIEEDSENIETIDFDDVTESNIIGFFRTGSIYFKPYSQLSFTFSELKLPDEVEDQIGNITERPRNTNPGKAWGAYNLKMALGILPIEKEDHNTSIRLKPWSIETCYGYWVPNKYRANIKDRINNKKDENEKSYLDILNCIREQGRESLLQDYSQYIEDAKNILKQNNIQFKINTKKLKQGFEKFLQRITSKLSNPKKLDRLCLPLISTGMPEIWEDDAALQEFSDSYFEYIENCLTEKPLPKIVRKIKEATSLDFNDDAKTIENGFKSYFKEYTWSDNQWD